MRAGSVAVLLAALIVVGCSKPDDDVPKTAKNDTPIAGSDQQLSQSSAAARAYGEAMQRQHRGR